MEDDRLSLPERELAEIDANNIWNTVYQRLKNTASVVYQDLTYKVSRKPENRNKNRYRDVSPYDHSRVCLMDVSNHDDDYMNANLVEAPEANRKYILTQGPLRNTSAHFWQMVWEQDSRAIIMLNRVVERDTIKCDQYWPQGPEAGDDDDYYFETCGLKVSLREEEDRGYYITRVLAVEDVKTGKSKEILHFHYTTWPDFGVPQSPDAFLNFLYAVRRSGSLNKDVGPAVIHCSAGIGRSGTFCLVDTCLVMIERTRSMSDLDIQQVLIGMRRYRMGLIQTPDQLRFSYLAVIMGGKKILSEGTIADTYQFTTADSISLPSVNVRQPVRRHDVDSDSDDTDLDGFIQEDDGVTDSDDDDDIPPPLPPRNYKQQPQPQQQHPEPPPVPEHRGPRPPEPETPQPIPDMTEATVLRQRKPLITDNDEAIVNEADIVENNDADIVENNDADIVENNDADIVENNDDADTPQYGVRRRNREERAKNTRKQIELMRERQRAAEIRRGFWTSWKPLAVGGVAVTLLTAYATYHAFVYMTT